MAKLNLVKFMVFDETDDFMFFSGFGVCCVGRGKKRQVIGLQQLILEAT
jgi:hypothetical protein